MLRLDPAILVIDDEPLLRAAIARSLHKDGFATLQAASGEDGLWAIDRHQFSCVLADVRLPDLTGHAFVRQCHRIAPTLPIVVMISNEDGQRAADCLREGAAGCVSKPFSDAVLRATVREAIDRITGRAKPAPVHVIPRAH
jgi:two-component system KDP operon response regulator KdpE